MLAVVARYEGATFQVVLDHFFRMTGSEQVERLGRIAKQTGARMHWLGLPTFKYAMESGKRSAELHEQFKAEGGAEIWTDYHHVPPTSVINFVRSLVFAQNGNSVWQEAVNAKGWDKKAELLADPAWLERARRAWDQDTFAHSYLRDSTKLTLRESESGWGPVGITLADYIVQTGIAHPSDALADWVMKNGAESVVHKQSLEFDDATILALMQDSRSVASISDGGAHGKMFCGNGDNVLLLTEYVRDRGVVTIEQAIHVQTGKLAYFFGLNDRGLIEEGKVADIVVFNLDEIERRPEERIWDVLDGEGGRTYRYTRAPAPMRLTLVNGVPIFDNGAFTGRYPGGFIGPESSSQLANAAE